MILAEATIHESDGQCQPVGCDAAGISFLPNSGPVGVGANCLPARRTILILVVFRGAGVGLGTGRPVKTWGFHRRNQLVKLAGGTRGYLAGMPSERAPALGKSEPRLS